MAGPDYPCGLDIANDLQRLAIHNENAIAAAHIEELLVGVWREGQIASKRYVVFDQLL